MAELKFSRINLKKTTYKESADWKFLSINDETVLALDKIYRAYAIYKKFSSVRPIFKNEYFDPNSRIIGYYDKNKLVAFTLIKYLDTVNVESMQFAWDYSNPDSKLGIKSLETECAIYREQQFEYLYLGLDDEYKRNFQGYEILGNQIT